MRIDQPLYAMNLPGQWTLQELEGADRWSDGEREVILTVLRVPAGETDRSVLLADLGHAVEQSRKSVLNFARGPLTFDDRVDANPDGALMTAAYAGDSEHGQAFVAVVMTAGPVGGLSYTATLFVLAKDARAIGPDVLAAVELGPG